MVRVILVAIAAAIVGALIALAVTHKDAKGDPDDEAVAPKAVAKSVTIENGEPTVQIDEKTQQANGLTTAPVVAGQQAQQVQLFGNVVDVQELAAMQSQLATARAQLQQANARAAADRAELGRL
ncbi:MAG TPA: hypothetical protein VLU46_13835, partial [Thermoanaerobaculia bacterium]|nr:hypothetical protein [Thermoanaerobaculia bacterium]